jgi:predicted nucleic acid-binding Zn ribbon protein
MPARSFFSPVGSVLTGLARRYGLAPRLLEYKLRHRWEDIAGEAIAAHTWPDAIRFKRLYLLVRDSVWLQQLTFLKPELIERINAAAGQTLITDIVLRVGEVGEQARRKDEGQKQEETLPEDPPEGAVAQAGAYAEAVSDPELRSRLAAVIAQALSPPRRPPVP